jgi:hypothetical protein
MDTIPIPDSENGSIGEMEILSISHPIQIKCISYLASSRGIRLLLISLVCLCVTVSIMSSPSVAQSVGETHLPSMDSRPTTEILHTQTEGDLHGPVEVRDGGNAQANGTPGENRSGTGGENNSNNTSSGSGGMLGGVKSTYDRYLGNTTGHYANATKQVGAAGGNVAQGDFNNASGNLGNATNQYVNGVTDLGQGANRAKSDAVNATADALPSGFGVSLNIATGWFKKTENRSKSMINDFGWMLTSVPAPGNATEPGTWYPGFASPVNSTKVNNTGNYTISNNTSSLGSIDGRTGPILPLWISLDGWWESAWKMYVGLTALVTSPLLVLGVFAWAKPGRARERDKRLQDVFVAFILVLFGVVIMPGILHGANLLSTGVVPGGNELLRTPGNIAKLGLGFLWVNAATVIVALLFGFIQWLMLFFIAALWPLYAALWASGSKTAKAYSKLGFSLFGFLLGVKFLQALWLRFIFFLPFDLGAPLTSLFSLLIIIIGLGIGFIIFPIYAAVKIVPSFVVNIVKAPLQTGARFMIYKK